MSDLLPIDVVIPTRHRANEVKRYLESISHLKHQPETIIFADASEDSRTERFCADSYPGLRARIRHLRLSRAGIVEQRMAAMPYVRNEFVMFSDDDIQFIDETFAKLLDALRATRSLGGVGAMNEGAEFHTPTKLGRIFYKIVFGRDLSRLPGSCFGPAIVMWVRPDPKGRVRRAEWVPTGCVLYRTAALPRPAFPRWMRGIVVHEDVALSIEVAARWRLGVHTGTMVLHGATGGDHKRSAFDVARRGLRDRYRVATRVMRRPKSRVAMELLLVEIFHILAAHRRAGGLRALPVRVAGRMAAVPFIVSDLLRGTTRVAPRRGRARSDLIRQRED